MVNADKWWPWKYNALCRDVFYRKEGIRKKISQQQKVNKDREVEKRNESDLLKSGRRPVDPPPLTHTLRWNVSNLYKTYSGSVNNQLSTKSYLYMYNTVSLAFSFITPLRRATMAGSVKRGSVRYVNRHFLTLVVPLHFIISSSLNSFIKLRDLAPHLPNFSLLSLDGECYSYYQCRYLFWCRIHIHVSCLLLRQLLQVIYWSGSRWSAFLIHIKFN